MPKLSYTEADFRTAVASNRSISATLRALGTTTTGGAYTSFHRSVARWDVDTTHFTGQAGNRGRAFPPKRPTSDYLIKSDGAHSVYAHSTFLRRRLLRDGLLTNRCALCAQEPEWNNMPLVLQLDHINGMSWDNRLENLRILCPNCHSQQATSRGYRFTTSSPARVKKPPRPHTPKRASCACGRRISVTATRCKPCAGRYRESCKIDWLPTTVLLDLLTESTYVAVARQLGVSDNALRKRIRNHPVPLEGVEPSLSGS